MSRLHGKVAKSQWRENARCAEAVCVRWRGGVRAVAVVWWWRETSNGAPAAAGRWRCSGGARTKTPAAAKEAVRVWWRYVRVRAVLCRRKVSRSACVGSVARCCCRLPVFTAAVRCSKRAPACNQLLSRTMSCSPVAVVAASNAAAKCVRGQAANREGNNATSPEVPQLNASRL